MTDKTKPARVLDFIAAYSAEHSRPPTYREITTGCGLKTPSMANYYVRALEDAGLIRVEPGIARGITIISKKKKEGA